MNRLAGKVAIVTGAGAGIGKATSLALAREGASVVVADIVPEAANAVVEEICSTGAKAISSITDVSSEDAIQDMVGKALDSFGKIDILHNNASNIRLAGEDHDLLKMDLSLWERTLAISLTGPMLGCKHVIPHMISAGGGSIINTSSINGRRGDATRTAYGTAKGGLNTFTQYMAATYGPQGVRCNSICPGVIRTQPGMDPNNPGLKPMLNSTPLNRMGEASDIAETVVFLASDEASFITGQIIEVDGGLLCQMPYLAQYRELGTRPGERTKD